MKWFGSFVVACVGLVTAFCAIFEGSIAAMFNFGSKYLDVAVQLNQPGATAPSAEPPLAPAGYRPAVNELAILPGQALPVQAPAWSSCPPGQVWSGQHCGFASSTLLSPCGCHGPMLDGFGVPNPQCASGVEVAHACPGISCGMGSVGWRSECQ